MVKSVVPSDRDSMEPYWGTARSLRVEFEGSWFLVIVEVDLTGVVCPLKNIGVYRGTESNFMSFPLKFMGGAPVTARNGRLKFTYPRRDTSLSERSVISVREDKETVALDPAELISVTESWLLADSSTLNGGRNRDSFG